MQRTKDISVGAVMRGYLAYFEHVVDDEIGPQHHEGLWCLQLRHQLRKERRPARVVRLDMLCESMRCAIRNIAFVSVKGVDGSKGKRGEVLRNAPLAGVVEARDAGDRERHLQRHLVVLGGGELHERGAELRLLSLGDAPVV